MKFKGVTQYEQLVVPALKPICVSDPCYSNYMIQLIIRLKKEEKWVKTKNCFYENQADALQSSTEELLKMLLTR